MNKQAYLEEVYNESFNDELEKIGSNKTTFKFKTDKSDSTKKSKKSANKFSKKFNEDIMPSQDMMFNVIMKRINEINKEKSISKGSH